MAQQIEFTIRQIEALPSPAQGRADYKDTKEQGLYLRVTSNGVKTFSFVGRAKGADRVERLTLGKFPQVKPDEARRSARELAGRLATGVGVAAAAREKKGELTVGELWDLYYAYVKQTTKAPGSVKDVWDTYLASTWSKRRLSDVTALDLEKWHLGLPAAILKRREAATAMRKAQQAARRDEIEARRAVRRHGPDPNPKPETPREVAKKVTGHVSANRALGVLRAMYNFALDPKRNYFSGANPALGHKFFRVPERERFIHPDEMGAFFRALAKEPNEAMRDAILIGLLTGQRRANFLAMRWSEVNFDRATWQLSGEFTKNGDPHTVPLVPEAVAILLERLKSRSSVFVFPSTRSKTGHLGDLKSGWRRLLGNAALSNIIVHDLRRTQGSWQARAGASLVIIGKSLNHKTPEATAIYARLDMDPVRQSVEGAASAMFEAGRVKAAAQVVPINAKQAPPAHGPRKAV